MMGSKLFLPRARFTQPDYPNIGRERAGFCFLPGETGGSPDVVVARVLTSWDVSMEPWASTSSVVRIGEVLASGGIRWLAPQPIPEDPQGIRYYSAASPWVTADGTILATSMGYDNPTYTNFTAILRLAPDGRFIEQVWRGDNTYNDYATDPGMHPLRGFRGNPDIVYFTTPTVNPGPDVGFWRTPDGGRTWTKMNPMPGAVPANSRGGPALVCMSVGVDPADPNRVYVIDEGVGYNQQFTASLGSVSADGGATFTRLPQTFIPPNFEQYDPRQPPGSPLVVNNSNFAQVLALDSHVVFATGDFAWAEPYPAVPGSSLWWSLVVQRSDDAGQTWTGDIFRLYIPGERQWGGNVFLIPRPAAAGPDTWEMAGLANGHTPGSDSGGTFRWRPSTGWQVVGPFDPASLGSPYGFGVLPDGRLIAATYASYYGLPANLSVVVSADGVSWFPAWDDLTVTYPLGLWVIDPRP
jgi:hypothetical protein